MINNIDELKNLILWAKENKIKTISFKDFSFEISEIGLTEHLLDLSKEESDQKPVKELSNFGSQTMVDTEKMSKEEYEDLLFHSTR